MNDKPTTILPGGKPAAWRAVGLESGGLAVAEVVSGGLSLGAFAFLEDLMPHTTDKACHALSKQFVEPNLDWIEKNLQSICHLKECQPDMNKSREERAHQYAMTIVKFAGSLAVNLTTKFAIRKLWNQHFGLEGPKKESKDFMEWLKNCVPSRHDLNVLLFDEGMHLGSLYLVNNQAAKYTDIGIGAVSNMLQTATGCSKKKADDMASMMVIWEMPNMVGLLSGTSVIAHEGFKNHGLTWKEAISRSKAHAPGITHAP